MKPFLILMTMLTVASPSRCQSPQAARYSVAFDAIRKDVQDNFYDPSILGVDWNAVCERFRPRLSELHDDATFVLLMREMLRQIPSSHLGLRAPEPEAMTGIGALTKSIDGRELVTDVWYASDAMQHGLRRGDIILTSLDKLVGPWGSCTAVRVESCIGKRQTLHLRRGPYGWPFERPSVRWQIIRPTPRVQIGYVRIQHFEDDFAQTIDDAMAELGGTSSLLIDLRNNSGGNASYLRLLSYLTPGSRMVFALLSRPYLNKFGRAPQQMDNRMISRLPKVIGAYTTEAIIDAFRQNGGGAAYYTEDLGTRAYHGKIFVLINQETASAAEGFAANLKGRQSVTLIGQSTAGAVVGAETFPVPGGWTLVLPTHAAWLPDGTIYRDEKTIPDVLVPINQKDLCNGNDAVLNRALDLVGAK